jgi:hypothetical protein
MREREAFVIRTEAERHDDRVRVALTVDLPDGVHIEPHEPAETHLIPTVWSRSTTPSRSSRAWGGTTQPSSSLWAARACCRGPFPEYPVAR